MSEWQPIETMPEDNADDVDARFLQAARTVPVVGEPVSDVVREYTTGRWHHGNGFLCMGTLRIARADLDTNPSAEVQSAFFDEICATLNAPIPATLREKAAEADELRKDAERYRWLREQSWDAGELCVVSQPKHAVKLGHDCPSLFRLDAAIDAAIAQEPKK